MDTYSLVREAFYSGGHAFTGDRQMITDIAFLVDEHYVSLHVFPIATYEEYRELLDTVEMDKRSYDAAGGSKEHVALKLLAGNYLEKKRGLSVHEVQYEHPLCGQYPDVMTADGRIIAECGHTHNPEKMLTYFKQGDINECICVPYPDPDEQNVSGYAFIASATLRDFLAFWDAERNSELQKKLRESGR